MVVSNYVPGSAKSMIDDDGGSLKWLVALVAQDGIKPVIHSCCSCVKVTGFTKDTVEEDSMKCSSNIQ